MPRRSEPKKNTAKQASARPQRTGLDRFAVPAEAVGASEPSAQAGASAGRDKPQDGRQPASRPASGAGQGRTQARSGQPQPDTRPARAAARLSGSPRARSERLRRIIRRKDRRARLTKAAAALLTVACSLFALTAFFQIQSIEFRGLTRYKADDVLATFGVSVGENMFFCDSWRGAKRVKQAYPYFLDVRVTRDLPGKLILNVTEATPAAAVNGSKGGWFILDQTGRVLEKTNEQAAGAVAEVIGLETEGSDPGTMLTVTQSPESLADLKTLLAALDRVGLLDKMQVYNVQDRTRIWVQYEDRFAVCLGAADDLDRKLGMLIQMLEEDLFSPSDKGKIDLSQAGRAVTDMSLTAGQVRAAARGQSTLTRLEGTDSPNADADGTADAAGAVD